MNAYLGEAKGNATQAAILAGYSQKTASVLGSRLLRHPDVSKAVQRRLDKAEFTVDDSLREVASVAKAHVQKVTAADKVAANKLFLQAHGRLRDQDSGASRITVNIGFLQAPDATPRVLVATPAITPALPQVMPAAGGQVMPMQAQVCLEPGE